MNYKDTIYTQFSIPREIVVFFTKQKKEYLLKTLYTIKHLCSIQNYGADISYIDPKHIAELIQAHPQTAKNHIKQLTDLGLIKPTNHKQKNLYYIRGHKQSIQIIRTLQDTDFFTVGLGKQAEDKKYIARLGSNYLSGYRFNIDVLSLDSKMFRTAVQGAIYIHNIKQQAYQEAKKHGNLTASENKPKKGNPKKVKDSGTSFASYNDDAHRGRGTKISCDVAGYMVGRSTMSGSRLRRGLEELGAIELHDPSHYVGHIHHSAEFQGYLAAFPDAVLVPVHRRDGKGIMVLRVECHETTLTEACNEIVSPYRIRCIKPSKRRISDKVLTKVTEKEKETVSLPSNIFVSNPIEGSFEHLPSITESIITKPELPIGTVKTGLTAKAELTIEQKKRKKIIPRSMDKPLSSEVSGCGGGCEVKKLPTEYKGDKDASLTLTTDSSSNGSNVSFPFFFSVTGLEDQGTEQARKDGREIQEDRDHSEDNKYF